MFRKALCLWERLQCLLCNSAHVMPMFSDFVTPILVATFSITLKNISKVMAAVSFDPNRSLLGWFAACTTLLFSILFSYIICCRQVNLLNGRLGLCVQWWWWRGSLVQWNSERRIHENWMQLIASEHNAALFSGVQWNRYRSARWWSILIRSAFAVCPVCSAN